MKELHLLIDDLRSGIGEDVFARTPEIGKAMLMKFPVTHLYMDHDLGLDSNGREYENGYKIVTWAIETGCIPARVKIVSSNPVGRGNIEAALLNEGYVRRGSWWINEEVLNES
jgi:hypothetical protein